jgi:hypothetical protein
MDRIHLHQVAHLHTRILIRKLQKYCDPLQDFAHRGWQEQFSDVTAVQNPPKYLTFRNLCVRMLSL